VEVKRGEREHVEENEQPEDCMAATTRYMDDERSHSLLLQPQLSELYNYKEQARAPSALQ